MILNDIIRGKGWKKAIPALLWTRQSLELKGSYGTIILVLVFL